MTKHFIFGFIFILSLIASLFSATSYSQNKIDSLTYQHFKDSVMAARNAEVLIILHREDSITKIKRGEFLKGLSLSDADTVTEIAMPHLLLSEMPQIQQFIYLQRVDLYHNKISNVRRRDWPKADSLESVNLENNELISVSFIRNTSIKSLNLSYNKFKRIPRSIRKLKSLKTLDISHNEISRIPYFIKRMDSLVELKLNYNQMKQLSKRAIRRMKNLKSIHLGANGLTEIPDNIDKLKNVETLNLGRNKISSIPPSIVKLDSIQHLIFYDNEFNEIPNEIFELKLLKELDFYYNNLKEIPEGVGSLPVLERLFLSYNEIDRIPDTVFTLKHLKALYMHHNKIIIIPDKITDLSELMYLDLGFNRIMDIPDLSKMSDLKEVDFQGNTLTEFPYTLIENKKLTHIFLMGNTFVMTDEERAEMQKLSDDLLEMGIRFYF